MSSSASFLAFVLLAMNASALGLATQKAAPGKPGPGVDLVCAAEHCLFKTQGCLENQECSAAIECTRKCLQEWDSDKTSEKTQVQVCTSVCQYSYNGTAYQKFLECNGDHKCLSLPPIPSQCRGPNNVTLLKKLPTSALNGSWWVIRGYNPVYDCYPCQHMLFKQISSNSWSLNSAYQVYLADGSRGSESISYAIPDTAAGQMISFTYHEVGLNHDETWWLIDEADDKSYILVYYCGNALEWYYDGALVLSREKALSSSAYEKIAESYQNATGLDAYNFCTIKTDQC